MAKKFKPYSITMPKDFYTDLCLALDMLRLNQGFDTSSILITETEHYSHICLVSEPDDTLIFRLGYTFGEIRK